MQYIPYTSIAYFLHMKQCISKKKKSQINAAHYDGCHTLSQALPNTPRILYKVLQFTQDSFLDLDGTFQDG